MTKQQAIERARELKARARTTDENRELAQLQRDHYYALWNDGHWN